VSECGQTETAVDNGNGSRPPAPILHSLRAPIITPFFRRFDRLPRCCHDTFHRRFGCMCCSSAKGEGCLRNGHPKGHPLLARGVLLVSFCLVIGLNVGIDNVRLEVRPAPSLLARALAPRYV